MECSDSGWPLGNFQTGGKNRNPARRAAVAAEVLTAHRGACSSMSAPSPSHDLKTPLMRVTSLGTFYGGEDEFIFYFYEGMLGLWQSGGHCLAFQNEWRNLVRTQGELQMHFVGNDVVLGAAVDTSHGDHRPSRLTMVCSANLRREYDGPDCCEP